MFHKAPIVLPKLRFKGFDGEWEEKSILSMGNFYSGINYQKNQQKESGNYYILRANNVSNSRLILKNLIKIELLKLPDKKYFVMKNDILICTNSGSKNLVGKSCIIKKDLTKYLVGGFMMVARNYEPILPSLLCHWKWFKAVSTDTSSTINSISRDKLSRINFFIPSSLPEQTKIAHFFSLLDKQIELWENKLQLVELIFKWYKNILFTKITKSNKLPFLCLFKEYVVKNYNNHPQYTIGKFGIQKVKNINYKIDNHKVFYNNSIILGLGIEEIIYNKNIIGSCSPIYKTFKLLDEYKHLENYFYFFIKKYFYSIKHKISKKSTRRDWEFDNKLLKELKIPLPNNMENKFIKKLLIIEKNINNLFLKKSNLNLKKSFYIDSILI